MLKCNEESKKNERWYRKVWKGKKKRQKKIMSDKSKVSKKVEKKETTAENNTDNLENLTYDSDIQINEHDSETYQYKLLCLANFSRFNTYQGWLNIGRLL